MLRVLALPNFRLDLLPLLSVTFQIMGRGLHGPRMSLLAELVMTDYQVNGRRSIVRARKALEHLTTHLWYLPLSHSYKASSDYILERQGEGAKPATISYEMAMLRRSLHLAKLSGFLDQVPALAFPKVDNVRRGFVTDEQLRRILDRLPPHLASAAEFAYITGWRRAEVIYMMWDQVDREAGVVRLEPGSTKNRLGRTYPYRAHPRLSDIMRLQWLRRDGEYVFHRYGKRHWDIHKAWKRACVGAGLPNILFHDLRRSAVRNMERARVPRSTAMQLTGHKTEYIYRRYAIQDETDLARGVELLANAKDK